MEKMRSRKRQDYITWDEYFMGIAELAGMRSKDPSTQVGSCIVSKENKILSMGYNGLPLGCSDDDFPWDREGDFQETKYPYVTHSELNAILNYRGGSLEGTKVYVTLFPCNECAKAIIQAGIKRVVYDSDKYAHEKFMIASRRKWEWRSISCATPLKLNIAYIGVCLYRLHKLGSTFSTDEKLYAGCTRGERLQFLG